MANNCLLGIDLGTTSVKAGVIRLDGTIVEQFSQSYPTIRSGGFVEQDPNDWVTLINAALDKFSTYRIAGIGLCSQVNTHIFLDEECRPLMPAIQWQDGRASTLAAEMDAGLSDAQKHEWWGAPMPIDASHAIARMAWTARHKPEIWARTRYVMLPKDFCLWQLMGIASTDPLSNIGLVGRDQNYIKGVFDLVPGALDRMAPLVPVTANAGFVKKGPFAGVPVVSGTMDAWAGLVGAGAINEGKAVYLSGTSEIIGISSKKVVATPGAIVFPECGGLRLHAGPTNNGGDAQAWFASTVGIGFDEMSEMISNTPRSESTPLFLPQLEGERAPLWESELRGAFMGITRKTTLADFARAVQEGVAFSARHLVETLKQSTDTSPEWLAGGGGGFMSDAWNAIRADVFGLPIKKISSDQPGVLGAAMIAGIGSGLYPDLKSAAEQLLHYDKIYEPDPARAGLYESKFRVYKDAITVQQDITNRWRHAAEG